MPSGPDGAVLRDLREQVRAATEPNYALERDIGQAFGGYRTTPPAYTASLDAALALFDRMLPGWSREVGRSGFGQPAWCRAWDPRQIPGANREVRVNHESGNEALAVCEAAFAAKLALTQGGSDVG